MTVIEIIMNERITIKIEIREIRKKVDTMIRETKIVIMIGISFS